MGETPDLPDLAPIIEALIFVSREALSIDKIVEILQSSDILARSKDVKKALKLLEALWSNADRPLGRGLLLQKINNGYAFASAREHAGVIKKIIQTKPIESYLKPRAARLIRSLSPAPDPG